MGFTHTLRNVEKCQIHTHYGPVAHTMSRGDVSFDICFDALQASLSSVVTGNASISHASKSELKALSRTQRKLESAMRSEVQNGLKRAVAVRIESLERQREAALLRMQTDTESHRTDIAAIETYKKKEMEGCLTQKLMSERRLAQQLLSAERRIRELVFEIIGEYGKSDVRFRRRQAYLAYNARIQVAWASHKSRWERFTLRLCHEATRIAPLPVASVPAGGSKNNATTATQQSATQQQHQFDALHGTLLDNVTDACEISALERRIWLKLNRGKDAAKQETEIDHGPEQTVRCLSVIRILKTKTVAGPSSAPASSFRTLAPMSVRQVADFSRVKAALRMWSTRPVRAAASQAGKDGKLQLVKSSSTGGRLQTVRVLSALSRNADSPDEAQVLPDFLRSRRVEWLHPPSHYPHIWDDLVDTRQRSQQAEQSAKLAPVKDGWVADQDDGAKKLTSVLDSFIERFGLQRSAFVASERMYYCLEERQVTRSALLPEGNCDDSSQAFAHMLMRIEQHYVDDADAGLLPLREQLEQVPLEVQSYLGTHRSIVAPPGTHEDVANMACMYPDVVSAKPIGSSSAAKMSSTTLHFVPATTYNLLETQAFADVAANAPPSSSHIRDIVRRGAYPSSAIVPSLAQDGESVDNNLTATEVDAARRFTLNLSRPQPLGRMYIAVRISARETRAETTKPIGKGKRDGRARGKGKRTARNRHVALAKRKASTSSTSDSSPRGDDELEPPDGDEEEEEDDADVDVEGDDANADRNSTNNGSSSEKTQLIMLPLSDLCMYEAICAEFWPNVPLPVDAKVVPKDDPTVTTEEATAAAAPEAEAALRAPSCVNLLPDHARLHLQPPRGAACCDDFAAQKFQHEYLLVGDEYSDVPDVDQPSSTASRASTAKPCYYFVQLEHRQDGSDAILPSPYGAVSELHASDDEQHRSVLLDRRSTGSSLSGEKSDGRKGTRHDEDPGKEKEKGKRKWDTAILSSVCRWRSCLAECTAYSTPKYLCAYHTSLHAFLEGTVKGGSGEAAKYLPKKVPLLMSSSTLSDSKKDLLMIRAASTLLQELWDGKLRATVRSFTKKVAHDMGLRRRLESSLNLTSASWEPKDGKDTKKLKEKEPKRRGERTSRSEAYASGPKIMSSVDIEQSLDVPPLPSWTHWKDADILHRATKGQSNDMANLETILDIETTISSELRRLKEMHVFPAQELSLIKKEVKVFKESFEGAIAHDAKKEYSAVYYEATAVQGSKSSTAKAAEEYAAMIAAESKVCEKKLHILRMRRGEEQDARQAQARRIARARAVEDSQARDPANFSQQRF